MSDRYFFDKRDWKRRFIKFGIVCAISFLPIVLFNIYCSKYFDKRWLLIFVDSMMLFVFFLIGNAIANRIFSRKDAALEKMQKERELMRIRQKKILEDSYKKKREEKIKKKNAEDVVVIEEKDIEVNNSTIEDNKDITVQKTSNPTTTKTTTKITTTKKNYNNKGRK